MVPSPAPTAAPAARSLRRYRIAAGSALFFLALIVVTGATVRLTGSGLGCPDWPSCHGTRPVPYASYHGVIEFSNRMISWPLLASCITASVLAFRLRPVRRDLRWGTSLAIVGVLAQIVIGGVSVLLDLAPLMVSLHFLVSILILLAATWAWHAGSSPVTLTLRPGARGRDRALVGTAMALLVVSALVIVAGVLTTASGPHSGGDAHQAVQRLHIWSIAVLVHARLSFAFAALVVGLTVWRRRSRAGARDLALVTLLVGMQITLGEVQYRNGLPWQVVLAHVANATLLWCTICTITWKALAVPAPMAGRDDASGNVGVPPREGRRALSVR